MRQNPGDEGCSLRLRRRRLSRLVGGRGRSRLPQRRMGPGGRRARGHLWQRPASVAPLVDGSPTLRGIADFPFRTGRYEIAGTIIEAGEDCPFAVGTRVAVDPIIPCLPRGIDPPCANCARGWASSCLHFDSHVMTGGRALGYTRGARGRMGRAGTGAPVDAASDPRRRARQGGRTPRADLDRSAPVSPTAHRTRESRSSSSGAASSASPPFWPCGPTSRTTR